MPPAMNISIDLSLCEILNKCLVIVFFSNKINICRDFGIFEFKRIYADIINLNYLSTFL